MIPMPDLLSLPDGGSRFLPVAVLASGNPSEYKKTKSSS